MSGYRQDERSSVLVAAATSWFHCIITVISDLLVLQFELRRQPVAIDGFPSYFYPAVEETLACVSMLFC